jgi:hypothetical protein
MHNKKYQILCCKKKKNGRIKLLRTYIALINTKIYNMYKCTKKSMYKCTKKSLTNKYVVKCVTLNYFILSDKHLGYGFKCL